MFVQSTAVTWKKTRGFGPLEAMYQYLADDAHGSNSNDAIAVKSCMMLS